MKEEIRQALEKIFSQPAQILNVAPVGGGCINETSVVSLSNGEKVFLKYHSDPPAGFFAGEAKGLELLGKAENGPQVPKPLAHGKHFLILEYIEEQSAGSGFYVQFGRALAGLHRVTQHQFGLDHDNFIGKTAQPNTLEENAVNFYREQRFRFQQALARKNRKLPKSVDIKLDKLMVSLDKWLDPAGEKPALLHGDLWSGNYFAGSRKNSAPQPFIFDPATHFGLREADLALTELFGRLPQTFYDAYNEAFPLTPGYAERKKLFNLYHLLNHLNLFGGSYLSSIEQTVNHFVR
jgi:fructosamine-3-kinase